MNAAYVDSSALIATVFNEDRAEAIEDRLGSHERLYSSNLLEAEVRSAFTREQLPFDSRCLVRIEWLIPDRPLESEIHAVLATGYLRGANVWHLATALYTFPHRQRVTFITLDERQRAVAAELGFQV